jgi:hypothetical protein
VTDELGQRLAANESVFRRVNEGIGRGQWPGEEDRPIGFRCECAQLGCADVLKLSMRAYEDVRANPRRFIVAPGHERPDVEAVVERWPDYLVVEKLGQAGEAATESDPRN